jgi:hypothetical protein
MLKELEDYTWFPPLFRRYQLEFIGSLVNWLKIYKPLVPILLKLKSVTDIQKVIDLCSGSGGPAIFMQQQIGNSYSTVLTDKFPPPFAKQPSVTYLNESVDVLHINPEPDTLYSMYNAFHHFTSVEQLQIIEKVIQSQSSIMIVEILTPSINSYLSVFLSGTILQWITAAFVKPFSFKRLVFTYIIPINIFTVVYDGLISVLRSKSVKQYKKLIGNISKKNYDLEVIPITTWKAKIICIKIHPKNVEKA